MKGRNLTILTLLAVLTALYFAREIVNPVLLALFIAIILVKPMQFLVSKKIPQGMSVTLVVLGILGVYFGLLTLLGSSISMFIENAPEYAESLRAHTGSLAAKLEARGISVASSVEALDPSKIMNYTADLASGLGGSLSNDFTLLLLTIFLLAEVDVFGLKINYLAKSSKSSTTFLATITDSIRHYLSIKTMTSLVTGALVAVGLAIIGVDYPILWGLIAFLLNYIPNIGSIIAAFPAIAMAFIQFGWSGVLWTALLYLIVNMLVGNVIEPKIMGKGLGLSTFVVFTALIFWGFVLGPVGMFLSVPITIAIKILLEQNDSTKHFALLLGNQDDLKILEKNND